MARESDYSEGFGRSQEGVETWMEDHAGSICGILAELRFRSETWQPYAEASEFIQGQGLIDIVFNVGTLTDRPWARCIFTSFQGISTPERERDHFEFYAREFLEQVGRRYNVPVTVFVVE